uniref:Ovule protein n=1 Tax=Acrobeloides nanus TaxID=290746 RepID=A0A914DE61_9BILA
MFMLPQFYLYDYIRTTQSNNWSFIMNCGANLKPITRTSLISSSKASTLTSKKPYLNVCYSMTVILADWHCSSSR